MIQKPEKSAESLTLPRGLEKPIPVERHRYPNWFWAKARRAGVVPKARYSRRWDLLYQLSLRAGGYRFVDHWGRCLDPGLGELLVFEPYARIDDSGLRPFCEQFAALLRVGFQIRAESCHRPPATIRIEFFETSPTLYRSWSERPMSEIEIAGKTYRTHPIGPGHLAALEAFVRQDRRCPLVSAVQVVDSGKVPDKYRSMILDAGMRAMVTGHYPTAAELDAFEKSVRGSAWKLWQAVRYDHPEIDSIEKATDLLAQMMPTASEGGSR